MLFVWDCNSYVKYECLFVDSLVNSATALFSLSVQILFNMYTYCLIFWKRMMLKKYLGICHFCVLSDSKYFYLIEIFLVFSKYLNMHIIVILLLCGVVVSNVTSLLNLKEL